MFRVTFFLSKFSSLFVCFVKLSDPAALKLNNNKNKKYIKNGHKNKIFHHSYLYIYIVNNL